VKLAVLGGGGFRVPLVFGALLGDSDRLIREVVLHDVSEVRLATIQHVLAAQAAGIADAPKVTVTTELDAALRGADFVFSAIRVGGLEGRARDERRAVQLGILGQETTGAGGVLYGLRTVPVARQIAHMVSQHAPDAWVINFTNPAGMVTEAMSAVLGDRVIGVCDSPYGLCRRVADVLNVPFQQVWFDYAGLNHLGWLTGVYVAGFNQLPALLASDAQLASLTEGRLFGPDRIRALGAIPNEYLAYWYATDVGATETTRGEFLRTQQERFYAEVAAHPAAAYDAWLRTRRERDETYMREQRTADDSPDATEPAGGYEGVALAVMRAIAKDAGVTVILDVRNRSAMTGLDVDAVVEVPCLVDSNGAHPFAVGVLDGDALALVQTVKQVERLTIEAAITGRREQAMKALALHPLVGPQVAAALLPE
jgi:6-phospho-beta-glucosidase